MSSTMKLMFTFLMSQAIQLEPVQSTPPQTRLELTKCTSNKPLQDNNNTETAARPAAHSSASGICALETHQQATGFQTMMSNDR